MIFLYTFIWITLIFHLISLRSDNDESSKTSRIEVSLSQGQCAAMIFGDGYSHVCHEHSRYVSLSNLNQHDFVTVVLYERITGYFRDILQYKNPGGRPSAFEKSDSSSSLKSINNQSNQDQIAVLFPNPNDIITTSSIDFHFYLSISSGKDDDDDDYDNNIVDKNSIASPIEYKRVCVTLVSTSTQKIFNHYIHSQCSTTDTSQIIAFHNISDGYYEAHYYVALVDKPILDFGIFERQFQHRMKALYSIQNENMSSTPKPMRKVVFSVQANDDDSTIQLNNHIGIITRQHHDDDDHSNITKNDKNTNNNLNPNNTASTYTTHEYSPVRIYINNNTWSILLKQQQQQQQPQHPLDIPINHVHHDKASTIKPLVHVLLLSVRSIQRYDEAVVMLKSLLHHSRQSTSSSSSSSSYIVVIHFILDTQGIRYFHRLWFKEKLYSQFVSPTVFLFHDFHTVCQIPVTSFLNQVSMLQSYHHSGIAGYCRLFLHDYFDKYRPPLHHHHHHRHRQYMDDEWEQQRELIESSVSVYLDSDTTAISATMSPSSSGTYHHYSINAHDSSFLNDDSVNRNNTSSYPSSSSSSSIACLSTRNNIRSVLVQSLLLNVSNIIALETDQLIMTDIIELWNMFGNINNSKDKNNDENDDDSDSSSDTSSNVTTTNSSSSSALFSPIHSTNQENGSNGKHAFHDCVQEEWLVAAAENYQPWSHSRAKAYRSSNNNNINDNSNNDADYYHSMCSTSSNNNNNNHGDNNNSDTNSNASTSIHHHNDNCTSTGSSDRTNDKSSSGNGNNQGAITWEGTHGYGLIGGVMLLRLQRMSDLEWSHHLIKLIQHHQRRIVYRDLLSQLLARQPQQQQQQQKQRKVQGDAPIQMNDDADGNRNDNDSILVDIGNNNCSRSSSKSSSACTSTNSSRGIDNNHTIWCQCYNEITKQIKLKYNLMPRANHDDDDDDDDVFKSSHSTSSTQSTVNNNITTLTTCQEFILASSFSSSLFSSNQSAKLIENIANMNTKMKGLWEAKQNDQDIFNAVFELLPSYYYYVLPCEWNIQFHARLNTFHHCLLPTILPTSSPSQSISATSLSGSSKAAVSDANSSSLRSYLLQHDYTFADIPLNCPESISLIQSSSSSSSSLVNNSNNNKGNNDNNHCKGNSSIGSNSKTAHHHHSHHSLAAVFVCERKPKILHFMAGAYKGYYHFLQYYSYSWEMYAKLSWNLVY